MLYLSGIHALNIEDNLDTCGDWHTSSLDWSNITLVNSENSLLKDWGIENNKTIPEHSESYSVANTLRAILDMMVCGKTDFLKGFREDFICTDKYNNEFFNKVILLRSLNNWGNIDSLMTREFMSEWDKFKEGSDV